MTPSSDSHIFNYNTIKVGGVVPCYFTFTDMRRLMTKIRSEKCVVRRFRLCANVIECTYINLDSTV